MSDIALKKVARTINTTLEKKDDKSFRLGGEEFAVFIVVNNQEEMIDISNKIINNIRKLNIEHLENDKNKIVTISIGAYLNTTNKNINDMLQCADKALYKAKQNGRDRLEVFN
jgi:diguanylate cyclase (GGDEF)-like protein